MQSVHARNTYLGAYVTLEIFTLGYKVSYQNEKHTRNILLL